MDVNQIPLDDPKTYELIRSGNNLGVFQIGEPWAKGIVRDVAPDCFEDIVALVALLRPGSIDNGTPKEYARRKRTGETMPDIHPEVNEAFEPLLRRSYGLPLYQEGALAIIKETTGWGYGEADLLFRAFGKKDLGKLAAARPKFFEASRFSDGATGVIWEILEPFADYSFGLAHSVSYAYTTVWTAYLKANYPREFIASLLTHEKDPSNLRAFLAEAGKIGVRILPPDINESGAGFTPTKEGVRYGLAGIKGIGPAVVDAICHGRRPYSSLHEFIRRLPAPLQNTRVFETLGKAGALDSLWPERESISSDSEYLVGRASSRVPSQPTLVDGVYRPTVNLPPDFEQRRLDEIELLGMQVSFPEVLIDSDESITDSRADWLGRVLSAHPGDSAVRIRWNLAGVEIPLSLRVNPRGLESVLASAGFGMELR